VIRNYLILFSLIVKENDEIIKKIETSKIELSKINIEPIEFDNDILISKKIELENLNKQKDLFLEWSKKMSDFIASTPFDPGYDNRIELLNRQLIDLGDAKIEVCPKCGYKNPDSEAKWSQRIQSTTNDLLEAEKGKNELKKALLEHGKRLEAIGKEPEYDNSQIALLNTEIKELENKQTKLLENQKLEQKKAELNNLIKELNLKHTNNISPLKNLNK